MKNLDYYVRLVQSKESGQNTYLSLIQRDISGGRISRQDIDAIKQFPSVTEISISGLIQDTFDYFIKNYGNQFKAIIFWKCPLVADLSKIGLLDKVEYIVYFWNQKAEKLWNFSRTQSLKGFCYNNFTRMHDISDISKSPSIEELRFGDSFWSKYVLNTLHPIKDCTLLRNLSFSAKKILDRKIESIAHLKRLEQLFFPANQFSTEQVAWLKAHLPKTLESKSIQAFWTIQKPINMNGKNKDTIIVGKRKPFLDSVQEKDILIKYIGQFDDMYKWFLENPKSSPDDYKKAA